ncbi:alpha-galactosidase, partial [Microbacterium oleivorans]|uniref:alpha-galactosidase n=1 Tax=Microbacterium oleivorans TaxID=273677 RepID=UPI001CB89CF8
MPVLPSDASVVHLRSGGTSVVVDLQPGSVPAIVHWGADLGDAPHDTLVSLATASRLQRISGGLDATVRLGVVSTAASGWAGAPSLEGHRDGEDVSALFALTDLRASEDALELHFTDSEMELSARYELRVTASGLVRARTSVRNDGAGVYTVQALHVMLPLPWEATEILDTTGRHLRERSAQRHELTFGTHLRESRRGRPGADFTLLLAAGTPGFGFERGTVHGAHLAWSGNSRIFAERMPTGESFLGAGELYLPGEIRLAQGEEISSPELLGSWGDGLDELAVRFHGEWRARPQHPTRPRPITLNTWEAVYFDHRLPKLIALADAAAEIGVERYVLDDGWFRHRRDDTAGLGDWYVDDTVWPDGLHPIADHVVAKGMEFGLWFEPEMVNPDSDLARSHPDWILRGRTDLPPSARQQQVLNLAHPEAYAYILEVISHILAAYPISYIKWDHNRDLVDAAAGPGGAARVHA